MTPRVGDGSPERDAWLREALRHAPDADAMPPAAVSDAILRQARSAMLASSPTAKPSVAVASSTAAAQATQPATQRSGFSVWRAAAAFWSWLARPAVAAGFASVMVATLVGLMWWNRPLDEALPYSPTVAQSPVPAAPELAPAPSPASAAESASTPAPGSDRAPANAAAPLPPPAAPRQRATAAALPPRSVAAAPAAMAPTTSADADRAAGTRKSAEARTSMADTWKPPSTTESAMAAPRKNEAGPAGPRGQGQRPTAPTDESKARAGAMAKAAVPESPIPPPATPPGPTPAPAPEPAPAPAPAPASASASVAAGTAAGVSAQAVERESAAPAGRSRAPGLTDPIRMGMDTAAKAAVNQAPAATGNLAARADPAGSASPLTALQTAVSAQPQRWAWQRGAAPPQAMNPAVVQWLSRLDATTRKPQTAAAHVPERTADAAQADGSNLLSLWRDGQLHALLRIGADVVRLDLVSDPAAAWQVSITNADGAALLRALDAATR